MSAPTVIAASGKEWDYIVLGDSSSWGFPKFYAEHIEQDLGVKVKIVNRTSGGLSSSKLLGLVRLNEDYRHDISQAEVITIYANPGDYIGWGIVLGSDAYDCSDKAIARYKADMDAIIAEIIALRKEQPTIIRTYNSYVPIYKRWKEWGKYEEYKRCWEALDRAVEEVSAARKIPFARVYDAFNGPTHDEDPSDKGYFYDGMHTNELGSKVMAEAFWKLGYEYIVP
jgi:lysophospholipase L1-like esterase